MLVSVSTWRKTFEENGNIREIYLWMWIVEALTKQNGVRLLGKFKKKLKKKS
jgi:hypothetical protein